MRLKIATKHFRQFHPESCRMAVVTTHCLYELFQRQIPSLNKRQGFCSSLDACGRDHVSCDLDCACVANFRSDLDDFFTARFEDRTSFAQSLIVSAHIINELTLFGCSFAPCKRRLDEPRLATFDNFSRGTH